MSAILDFKQPTLVVVGAWNQAILSQPEWLSVNIFGFASGEEFELPVINFPDTGKNVYFINGVGVACLGDRLELYCEPESDGKAIYAPLGRLVEVLPHTPVAALGVNFMFNLIGDFADSFEEQLQTTETLDALGEILQQERADVFLMDEGVKMTIKRRAAGGERTVSFNFHYEINNLEVVAGLIENDFVAASRARAEKILIDTYEADRFEAQGF